MAAPALVQSNGVGTSVNSPASINAALTGASTKGNFLLMAVGVTGATPTISTPTNWTLVGQVGNASIAIAVFIFPNNPGGITTVAVTLTNATNGGAVASMFEFSNEASTQETLIFFTENTQFAFSSPVPTVQQLLELSFFTCAFQASATLSNDHRGADYSANTAGATSTVATTNVTIVNLFAINAGPKTPTQLAGGISPGIDLSGTVQNALLFVRYSGNGSLIANMAGAGIYIGQGGNPAGSLEVPQPQAPGSFFSGSIGVG